MQKTCLNCNEKAFSILAHVRIKIYLEGGDILKIYPEGEDIMDSIYPEGEDIMDF